MQKKQASYLNVNMKLLCLRLFYFRNMKDLEAVAYKGY